MIAPRRGRRSGLVVVKLGGSLARSPHLTDWLDAVVGTSGRLVLVPGGGPFADQVRELQAHWGFDDPTADAMAILAMEQFGRMLAALRPELRPAESRTALVRTLRQGDVPVWLPTRMTANRPQAARSWDVTSDSLAAWLAGALRARDLILVKSTEVSPGQAAAPDLAAGGLVDRAFPRELAASGARCVILGAGQFQVLRDGMEAARMAGCRVVCP